MSMARTAAAAAARQHRPVLLDGNLHTRDPKLLQLDLDVVLQPPAALE